MDKIQALEGKKLTPGEFCTLARLYAENGMTSKALSLIEREISYEFSVLYDTALNLLGSWHYEGKYVARDYEKAKDLFEKASFMNKHAQYNLGIYYFQGRAEAPNYLAAAVNFDMADKMNHPKALTLAAEAYFKAGNFDVAIERAKRGVERGQKGADENLKRYTRAKENREWLANAPLTVQGSWESEGCKRDDGMLDLLTAAMGFGVDVADI